MARVPPSAYPPNLGFSLPTRRPISTTPANHPNHPLPPPQGRPAVAGASSSSPAATTTATTWQAWESVLPDWKSHKPESSIPGNKDDRGKLAAAVCTAALDWKPPPSLAAVSLDDLGPDIPRNLHERLALVARLQLADFTKNPGVDPTVIEFTTTDVTAALSVAGVMVTEKGKRTVRGAAVRVGGR